MSYLWPSLVSTGVQGESAPLPPLPRYTPLRVASHVLMDMKKKYAKVQIQYIVTNFNKQTLQHRLR